MAANEVGLSMDHLRSSIDSLRDDVQALTQGLMLLAETMDTHGEMLSQILAATAAEPTEAENPIAETLDQILGELRNHGKQLSNISVLAQAIQRGVAVGA